MVQIVLDYQLPYSIMTACRMKAASKQLCFLNVVLFQRVSHFSTCPLKKKTFNEDLSMFYILNICFFIHIMHLLSVFINPALSHWWRRYKRLQQQHRCCCCFVLNPIINQSNLISKKCPIGRLRASDYIFRGVNLLPWRRQCTGQRLISRAQ